MSMLSMDAALELDHPVLFICYIIFFNKIRTYHRYLFIFSRVISQIYQGYTVYTRGYLKIYRHAVKKKYHVHIVRKAIYEQNSFRWAEGKSLAFQ